jgi:peptidyl-prolyl cis-trans isomerase C
VKKLSILLLGLTVASTALAGDDGHRAKVAVKAARFQATVGEIEDRIAEMPHFQVETYGKTRDEIAKNYVNQVIVRELVLNAGAEQRHLTDKYPTKQVYQRTLSTATLRAIRGQLRSPNDISDADAKAYFDANRARYEAPERVNLWRILCKTKEEAAEVIAAAKKDLTIAKYNDLARDHSLDKATNFRGGNLGFVAPDGQSNEAGVKIDVALLKAAANVKDGDLVPDPVAEGSHWAVVWRRTTVAATKRTYEDVSAQIKTTIYRERTEANEKKVIEDLRASKVKDYDPEPLKVIEFPTFDAGLNLPRSVPSAAPKK